jgi:hypothetical protein
VSLPDGFTPLTFAAARGVPQQASHEAAGRQLTVTLLATTADLPRVLDAEPVAVAFDSRAAAVPRTAVPADARAAAVTPPPDSAAPGAVGAYLVVADPAGVLGAVPAVPGRPLPVASGGDPGLLVELWVDDLVLPAGSLVRPGELGGSVVVGIRDASHGATEPALPPLLTVDRGDPHDALV